MDKDFVLKKDLVKNIYLKLNKVVSQEKIRKAIDALLLLLIEELKNNNAVSINNFGTFSPYLFKGHTGYNVNNGKFIYVDSFINLRFRVHSKFKKLIDSKKTSFRKL